MRNLYLIVTLLIAIASTAAVGQVNYKAPQEHLNTQTKQLEVFPNPVIDYVHIKHQELNAEKVTVTVYNLIGNELKVETEVLNEHEIRLRFKDLDSGYYLISVQDQRTQNRTTFKIVKR